MDGRGYLAWYSRTSQLLTPALPEPGGLQGRHRYPYITDEKTSVCVESRLKVAFSIYPLRKSSSTLPQPSAQKQHVAFKERFGKLQQLGSLN